MALKRLLDAHKVELEHRQHEEAVKMKKMAFWSEVVECDEFSGEDKSAIVAQLMKLQITCASDIHKMGQLTLFAIVSRVIDHDLHIGWIVERLMRLKEAV